MPALRPLARLLPRSPPTNLFLAALRPPQPPSLHHHHHDARRALSSKPSPPLPPTQTPSDTAPILNRDAAASATATSILPLVAHLTSTTPWRLTRARTGLERHYVFGSASAALAFAEHVRAWARERNHDPEWAGCGRAVFVRWTTHRPRGLGRGDVEGARECERVARQVVGAAEEEEEEGAAEGEERWVVRGGVEDLRPEWRRMAKPTTGRESRAGLEEVWGWVRERAMGGQGEAGYWPVWSHVYGDACVSQTRWRVVEGEDGRVVGFEREPYKGSEEEERVWELELERRSGETDPKDRMGKTLHELLIEMLWGGGRKE
ncbi:hypothetical protein B0J12DRAFT_154985 [Macrophomina phaseolina]|uniref:4a-hydroxytetrahydrobiopterin dehydratase n=1 Tax=Macrophomina phaseolina TaxID=35725 RepID=A0ABQ8G5F3_9PEZI|nr:hypothetical protein B0J12DRAFT_154985 [Macrophomina phaseolina]